MITENQTHFTNLKTSNRATQAISVVGNIRRGPSGREVQTMNNKNTNDYLFLNIFFIDDSLFCELKIQHTVSYTYLRVNKSNIANWNTRICILSLFWIY